MKRVFFLIMILVVITGCGCAAKDKTIQKKNTNKEIVKDREVDGLKFSKTSLSSINNHWTLITLVTNDTESDYELNEFKIIFKDRNGNIITTLIGYVGGIIPKGSQREINSGTYIDLSRATNVEYEVIK